MIASSWRKWVDSVTDIRQERHSPLGLDPMGILSAESGATSLRVRDHSQRADVRDFFERV